jgi:hypothetical protein
MTEVPGKRAIPHLEFFIGNPAKVIFQPFSIFFLSKGRLPPLYPSVFLPFHRISGMGSVQGALVLKVDIGHRSSDIRVYSS